MIIILIMDNVCILVYLKRKESGKKMFRTGGLYTSYTKVPIMCACRRALKIYLIDHDTG